MKKSEMVEILAKSVIRHMKGDAPSDDVMYERILDDLVEYGMKPPVKTHDPVLLTHSYRWEPEND